MSSFGVPNLTDIEIPESVDGFWAKSLLFVADSAGWVWFAKV